MSEENTTLASRVTDTAKGIFRRRLVRYGLSAFAVLFLLFGLLGYLWLPGFAKAKLEALLSEEFSRPVQVERIEVSPYTLSATIKGFAILQANGSQEVLFGFDSLYVNLSSTSIARAIPVVSEVRLTGPRLNLVRREDGRFNVSDLLDKWTAPAPEPKEPEKPAPRFSVSNIRIEGGAFTFDDQQQHGRQELTELTLAIPFVANTSGAVDSDIEPKFSARINGAAFSLSGKARPFAKGKVATLELALADFDLMRVFQYAPPDLPARLESAKLDTRLELAFAQEGTDSKVRLSGDVSLRELAVERAQPGGAKLRLSIGRTDLHLAEATLAGKLSAKLAVADLALAKAGDTQPFAGFGGLAIDGISVSTAEKEATVESVALSKPFGVARRLAGGVIDVAAALGKGKAAPAKPAAPAAAKPVAKAEKTPQAAKAAPAQASKAAWKWRVEHVAVSEGSLRFSDETLPKARALNASALALKLDGLSSDAGKAAKLDFSTRVNEQGGVKIAGSVQPEPLKAALDLDLNQVDLVALQGWATEDLNAVLTRGDVSAKGHVDLDGPNVAYKGDLALMDFSVLDKLNSLDLLRWRSLKLSGINAGSKPLRANVDEIAISSFFAKLLLTPEGHLNLQDVMKKEDAPAAQANATTPENAKAEAPKPDAKPAVAAAPAPATASAEPAPSGPPLQLRVGRVLLSGGNINFTDRFIRPNYTANLTDLSGRIGVLAPGTPTELDIKGKVDKTAPLTINGKMDPLAKPISLDIVAIAKGIEMSSFSPYSGRYVGYNIEKGKLSVDLRYFVDKGKLKADNKIFLDQLTFGKKVESKDAANVPVNLLVALLSNSKGEIDINLPIEGSLNDPQFSVGGIILKVLWNIIVKAATSPFSLLASLFGGGEDLSYLAFEPGRATFTEAADKPLNTLAKALRDRPSLKLEVTGAADPAAEQEGLKRAMLDIRVRAQKATELARQGKASGSVAELTVTPEEYPRYLERVYKAADIKKPRNLIGMAKTLPVEQMEALLLASYQPGPDDMARLAKERGIAVQSWLVDKGGVDQSRVFLMNPKVGGEAPKGAPAGGRVDFSLR